MATAGIKIVNQAGGSVQIDQTYRNLCLRQKGNAVTNGNLVNGCSYVLFFVSGLTTPIVAVGGGVRASVQVFWDAANARHGVTISAVSGIGTSIPYYIFDVPKELGSKYGLLVRDPSGKLIFDALQPPLRVRGFYVNATSGDSTLTAGRTYAVAHLMLGFRANTVEIYSRLYGTAATSNGFSFGTIDFASIVGQPQQTLVRLPTLLAIDVTDY